MNETKRLLKDFYKIEKENLPKPREKSKWKSENKFGFLLGIIEFGLDSHTEKLHKLLRKQKFKEEELSFINDMYLFYIFPFKQANGSESSCHTRETISSHPSRQNSAEDLDYFPEGEKKLTHYYLKKAVLKRDGVCLFCWDRIQCECAHILAQKEVPFQYDEKSFFERTGLKKKHQVQNGLLLCSICYGQFEKLKRFVDVVEDKLVVKVVNETDDENNFDWIDSYESIIALRTHKLKRNEGFRCRQVLNDKGEMELYFLDDNQARLPNRKALEFHKTSCLIWRMAGGAESDEEYCPNEYDSNRAPSDIKSKSIHKWIEDSNVTSNTFID
jgi:hypothetical protein